ncbi:transposase [Enterococcus faecium]|uniref:transposase n=1 Tax=Enterococcus faecium TaxID=1352 RepID=UPI001065BA8D|nr:transposase [Enterococcus faecium]TEA56889.1 hypothetical protein CWC53_12420 [Enterococcus faecium]
MRSSKYTEHYTDTFITFDDIPDYEMYSQTIDSLNKRFGNRVLKGIEIGYIASEKDRIIDYLADKDSGLKLLSVHDVKVLETLSEEANLPNILGDKGYISHKIHEKLALKGITISVPPRKNMDKSEKLDHSLLGKQRKTVETVFSSLEKLGCQNFNSRSVKGLESRFESILLAYSVLLSRAQRRFEGTLRYSLGY